MSSANMTVRKRLSIGFGSLIALIAILALTAVLRLNSSNKSLESFAMSRVPKVVASGNLTESLLRSARAMRDVLILDNERLIKEAVAAVAKNKELQTDYRQTIEKLLSIDKEKELFKAISDAQNQYAPLEDQFVKVVTANDLSTARDLLVEKVRPAQQQLVQAIAQFSEFEVARSTEEATEAAGVNKAGSSLIIVLSLIAMVGGAIAAALTIRSLISQLGGEPAYAAEVAQRIANGDLVTEVKTAQGDFSSLLATMRKMQKSLRDTVHRIQQASETISSASTEIASGNSDLSTRTEKQASSLQQTAASMEQLGSTVNQNADNARQANSLARGASEVAVKGGDVVGQVVNTMKGINDSSRKIADIITVIDGIAFQTNILALNAAVEAARAGEQGRGFAVVASEVRNLAQRSADAAKEIKSLITASVQRVEQGTSLVDQAGATMSEIVSSIKRVTDIMGEISSASAEQSEGVAQVGEAVSQMDQATQQNAALVEQSAASAETLREQAMHLVQAVSVFKLGH